MSAADELLRLLEAWSDDLTLPYDPKTGHAATPQQLADGILRQHAHELAERQRDMLRGGFRMPMFATILTTGGHEPLGTTHVIDDIDPEITTIRPARVALAELQPEVTSNG